MVITQIVIAHNAETGELRTEINLLRREDATPIEYEYAKAFQEVFLAVSQAVADEEGVPMTLTRIDDPPVRSPETGDDGPIPAIGDRARCTLCEGEITFVGTHWEHDGIEQPRHPAVP